MARIRSIHPGQANDADFVECTIAARYLAILLRNFADDNGVFVWRPKQIKMDVFPADSLDVEPLLDELVANRQVKQFEIDGESYGVFRNFKKWQRPDRPNTRFPIDELMLKYAGNSPNDQGSNDGNSPNTPPSRRQKSPNTPQSRAAHSPNTPHSGKPHSPTAIDLSPKSDSEGKERIGTGTGIVDGMERTGTGKDARATARSPGPDPILSSGNDVLEETLREAAGWQTNKSRKLAITGPIQELLDRGVSLEYDILPVVRMCAPTAKTPSWMYFLPAILEAYANRVKAATGPPPPTGAMSHEEAERIRKREEARQFIEEHNAKALANGKQPSP
jgi:hypothetical protein